MHFEPFVMRLSPYYVFESEIHDNLTFAIILCSSLKGYLTILDSNVKS
jgi:hypothetical protein